MRKKERDLAAELYQRLKRRSADHADRFYRLFIQAHPGWTQGPLPHIEQQVRDMSNFWRFQLGMLNVDTVAVRSCIVDHIGADLWLENFETHVMQAIIPQMTPSMTWRPLSA